MKKGRLFILGIGLGLVFSAAASAQSAFTTKEANLRAGPNREYPVVALVPGGTPVEVGGCVDDWTWCDISVGPDRGWMYAGNLEYPYENRRVVIMHSGGFIGLPIVPYVPGTYWDTYYRGRPWYGRRSYWVGRGPYVHRSVVVRPPGPRAVVVHPAGPRVHESRTAPRQEHRTQVQQPRPASKAPATRPQPRPSGGKKPSR